MLTAALSSVMVESPRLAQVEKPCQIHPNLIGQCFTIHGRLSRYNGTPSARIWEIGTKRLLGVSEGRFVLPGYRNIPKSLEDELSWDTDLVGDFVVCPFTLSRPNEMQLVCIESASNVVPKRK
jgi:hypothetical protein